MGNPWTPGPWFWSHRHGLCQQAGENEHGPIIGAFVLDATYDYDTGTDIVVSDADAALIAEAPAMAELIEQVGALMDAFAASAQGDVDDAASARLWNATRDKIDQLLARIKGATP